MKSVAIFLRKGMMVDKSALQLRFMMTMMMTMTMKVMMAAMVAVISNRVPA